MPKQIKKEEIQGRYFRWLLGQRNGVYFADGRSNQPSLGRQTLGTRDKSEALSEIEELDLTMAVRHGLAPLASQFPPQGGEPGFLDGRLHSFRHYFCSNCANSGVKERVLMNWLGHRNSRMVHRYYHLHDEESIRQMQQVKLY